GVLCGGGAGAHLLLESLVQAVLPCGLALGDAQDAAEAPHVRGGDEGDVVPAEFALTAQVRAGEPADLFVDVGGHDPVPSWGLRASFRRCRSLSPAVRRRAFSSRISLRRSRRRRVSARRAARRRSTAARSSSSRSVLML